MAFIAYKRAALLPVLVPAVAGGAAVPGVVEGGDARPFGRGRSSREQERCHERREEGAHRAQASHGDRPPVL